jgi:ribosomal protein L7/L12
MAMEPTPDTTEEQNETQEIDSFWLVANIFAIISLLEEKFGPQAIEQVVMVATAIENSMRAEAEKTE